MGDKMTLQERMELDLQEENEKRKVLQMMIKKYYEDGDIDGKMETLPTTPLVNNLRFLLSDMKQKTNIGNLTEESKDKSDAWILLYLQSIITSQKKTLESCGSCDKALISVCERYLPKKASEEEIISYIESIDFSQYKSLKDATKGIGLVMKHFNGLADGRFVKEQYTKIAENKIGGL